MDDRIEINPNVHHGAPVIRGTRVLVARLVGSVAGGDAVERVADAYGVSIEDVRAALTFAAEAVMQQQYYPLPKTA